MAKLLNLLRRDNAQSWEVQKELVKIIQTDAMDRCGLKQLIFEPEILEQVEPDINLASTIMLLKEQIPQKSKESVRAFIKKIVE